MLETTPTRLMMILNEDRDDRRHTSPYTTIIDRSRAFMSLQIYFFHTFYWLFGNDRWWGFVALSPLPHVNY
jgi:hypothetical protein